MCYIQKVLNRVVSLCYRLSPWWFENSCKCLYRRFFAPTFESWGHLSCSREAAQLSCSNPNPGLDFCSSINHKNIPDLIWNCFSNNTSYRKLLAGRWVCWWICSLPVWLQNPARAIFVGFVTVGFIWDLISCCCDTFMALPAVIGAALKWQLLWVVSFGTGSGVWKINPICECVQPKRSILSQEQFVELNESRLPLHS